MYCYNIMKRQYIAFIAGAIFLILFFFTREDAKILAYEGEDKFSFIDPSELPKRHMSNFNKLKQALAKKGHRGVRMNWVATGRAGSGGEGRCRHGFSGGRNEMCNNPHNDCREAIVWCPAGTVAAARTGGNKPPCMCASFHANFSGYHFNPV